LGKVEVVNRALKFLLDTSVVIPAEPTSPEHLEPETPVAVDLLRALAEGNHQTYLHPESLEELRHDKNVARRKVRELLISKYPVLPTSPAVSNRLKSAIGSVPKGSHDAVDQALLAAVDANAVDYLVTSDRGLISKSVRAGLRERVATPAEAAAAVRGLFRITPLPPPAVREIPAYDLDEADLIFDSLRTDYYPDFNSWLTKCKLEHRQSWVISNVNGTYAAITIVKNENSREYGLGGRLLKICSFKISDLSRGYRFGELLLKALFNYAYVNDFDHLYVEIFPKYADAISLFEDFGFQALDKKTNKGELVLAKGMKFSRDDYESYGPFEFNVRFGPRYIKLSGATAFVVPIMPEYHRLLFPEFEEQQSLMQGQDSFGNSIRKAYLCHAPIRGIRSGDALLFYRSQDEHRITCIGVAEKTLVSSHPNEIASFVGKRTVYSYAEIEKMTSKPVLAILFRLARVLDDRLSLDSLIEHAILTAAPRSIVTVKEEGIAWLRKRLELWP
jgi:L-amino acid N-acyltransferase YncA/predicted nucleic acid-binding protein